MTLKDKFWPSCLSDMRHTLTDNQKLLHLATYINSFLNHHISTALKNLEIKILVLFEKIIFFVLRIIKHQCTIRTVPPAINVERLKVKSQNFEVT